MAILRHSRIALTMEIYTGIPDKAARDALGKPSGRLDQARLGGMTIRSQSASVVRPRCGQA